MIVGLAAIGAIAAGLAGTGAYLVVSRYLQDQGTAGPDRVATAPLTPATTTTPARPPCPQFTIDAVRRSGGPGDLVEVWHVQGRRPGGVGGEAWICLDTDGTLYYQGHDLTGPATAATSDNTILVGGDVQGDVRREGQTYVATNGGTQYLVGPDTFAIIDNGDRQDFTDLVQNR